MALERIDGLAHPRRAAIGAALSRAFPLPAHDREEMAERKLLRRHDVAEAVK